MIVSIRIRPASILIELTTLGESARRAVDLLVAEYHAIEAGAHSCYHGSSGMVRVDLGALAGSETRLGRAVAVGVAASWAATMRATLKLELEQQADADAGWTLTTQGWHWHNAGVKR